MDLNKASQYLSSLLDDLNDIKSSINTSKLDEIQRKTHMLIRQIFGEDSEYLRDLNKISFQNAFGEQDMEIWVRGWNKFRNLLNVMLEELQIKISSQLDEQSNAMTRFLSLRNEVFIVHGHDELNLLRLQKLLRERWELDSIIMSDQPGKGRTLIEKFEEEAQRSAYAIVLMTPDDLIQLDEDNYTQARPNVIFELGWFYGRLGRPNVCILFKRGTRIHSDLDGISRIEFTESVLETRDELEQELLAAEVLRLPKIAQSSIPENVQKTVPALLSELKDGESSKIRARAARTLGKISGTEVLSELMDAINDKSPGVKAAAKAAIEEIQGNSSVSLDQSIDLTSLLVSHRWELIFRPPNQSKPISFLADGSIGEGQNQNEHTWRIQNNKLELIQEDGHIHSRFNFVKETQRFIHTNDPDTLSVKNQIIQMV